MEQQYSLSYMELMAYSLAVLIIKYNLYLSYIDDEINVEVCYGQCTF